MSNKIEYHHTIICVSYCAFFSAACSQVVLDITFYEENKLVDQEFPEDTSPFKIQQLLQDLTEPEVLAGRLVPAQEVVFACKQLLCHLERCHFVKNVCVFVVLCHCRF